ncbi:hypothetical protein KR054_001150 [Drosophila jambulina]|nr:hypothetical protein KR054_001150 [Drosophila jambulina]
MLPNWLTEEYLQPRLRAYCKDDRLKVLKIWSKAATGKGENFVGIMTRIYVNYQLGDGSVQEKSYIVKQALPEDVPQAEVFFEYELYTREMDMYEFVLRKMKELLQEAGLSGRLTADAITVDREHSTMILEDLAPYKYVNADRVKLLDVPHTKLTLEMLAKFHAAGVVLKQRHPELITNCFYTHFFSRDKVAYREVYTGMFRALLRFVDGQPNLKKNYGDKLAKLSSHIMEYGARVFDVENNELQTLTHGDCWTTNVMFHYDAEGNPQSVVAIDFQLGSWTSPAIDLHYFLTTSLREELKDREAELVAHHYSALKSYFEKLSYTGLVPSLEEYQLQFERRRFMSKSLAFNRISTDISRTFSFQGLLANLFKPVMIYNGSEETSDFSSLYKETPEGLRYQTAIYASDAVLKITTNLLALLDSKQLLDIQK